MSTIKAYDFKARKNVSIRDPQPYLMNNGMWAVKGTSIETGAKVFRIVGKTKPSLHTSKWDTIKNIFTSRRCECAKSC